MLAPPHLQLLFPPPRYHPPSSPYHSPCLHYDLPFPLVSSPSLASTSASPLIALTAENLLLHGTWLKNTRWVYGLAVYTGPDTKLSTAVRGTAEPSHRLALLCFPQLAFHRIDLFSGTDAERNTREPHTQPFFPAPATHSLCTLSLLLL